MPNFLAALHSTFVRNRCVLAFGGCITICMTTADEPHYEIKLTAPANTPTPNNILEGVGFLG
jgi:hypothetical protein